jgi:surface polysaccharide O-acyltransferase-like enzyme
MSNKDEASLRIDALRFPLILGVAFIHGGAVLHTPQGSFDVIHSHIAWVDFIVNISQNVADVSTPLFFAIAGYLFFWGGWSREKYAGKLKRRFHTLLIPYLFWSLATFAVLAAAESIPLTKMYFADATWPSIRSLSFFGGINTLLGISGIYPLLHPFWFIRDLMGLVVLAPALHFLVHNKWGKPFLIALFCMWYGVTWPLPVWPLPWPGAVAMCFFCLGAYLSQRKEGLAYLDRIGPWASLLFLAGSILNYAFPSSMVHVIHALIITAGAPSLWWIFGLITRSAALGAFLVGLSGDVFFVFATHQPLMAVVRKIAYKLFSPASGAAILTLYFLIPICLVALLVAFNRCLLKIMPSFIGFITGNPYRPHKQHA